MTFSAIGLKNVPTASDTLFQIPDSFSPRDAAASLTLSQFFHSATPAAMTAAIAATIRPIGPVATVAMTPPPAAAAPLAAVIAPIAPLINPMTVLIAPATLPTTTSTGPTTAAIPAILMMSCCAPGDNPSQPLRSFSTTSSIDCIAPWIIGAAELTRSAPISFRLLSTSVI